MIVLPVFEILFVSNPNLLYYISKVQTSLFSSFTKKHTN